MTNRTLNLLAVFCAALRLSATGLAQETVPEPKPATISAPAPAPRGDIEFGGGTVKQYLDLVGKVFVSANAVIDPRAVATMVAPVQLSRVTRGDAVQAIEALTSWRVQVVKTGDTYAIVANSNVLEPPAETPVIRVWPLAKTLARMKPEEALSAVQAAIDLAGDGASVKFHPDTSLLIVKGTAQQIDAVSQVVDRLENVAGYREGERERAERKQTAAGIEEEVRALQAEVARLSAELKTLMQAAPGTPGTAR